MWKDYSVSYLKNNRFSSISIIAAALISAMCLSFLCSIFFNLWVSDIDNLVRNEGDWQGRITGEIGDEELALIQSFANVEKAVVNPKLSEGRETAVDVYFHNMRAIFRDMPLITEQLGAEETAAEYHLTLLSRYLIHDPQNESPPMLMVLYLSVLLLASLSLILIIHNSFAVSMRARIRQLGIFSSVGATPAQIRACLLQEALALCLIPIAAGDGIGIAFSFWLLQAINILADHIPGAYVSSFAYHPAVLAITFLLSVLTVLFSAWIPAAKLSKVTPLEAIRDSGGLQLKKETNSRILSALFGIEGELAGNALRAQKKALRTSTLSLTLSFLSFTILLCQFTLSDISTRHTYFEGYQDAWDVMVTVKNTEIGSFGELQTLNRQEGVRDCAVYQKAAALCPVPEEWQSEELTALGGLGTLSGSSETKEGVLKASAPVVILDDESFARYCRSIGIAPRLDGTIVLNRIWDSQSSNFRYKKYVPFVREDRDTVVLQSQGQGDSVSLPILAYTKDVPVLREEYEDYALVQFVPLSVWKKISGRIGGAGKDTFIRVLAGEEIGLSDAEELENHISSLIGDSFEIESENRIGEKIVNDKMIFGYLLILGGLCALLAIIGIANVFSNTLGFLTQRKQEFARCLSVGMTPAGVRRMFCVEALVIAGRPLLVTLPLAAVFVEFVIRASHLNRWEFWSEAPLLPISVFCLAIFGFVALAYYLGGKRLLRCDLSEALRNDTLS